MIIVKLLCIFAFGSLSSALQFVQVGERLATDTELPIVEILDTSDNSVCTVSNSYHDFTSNQNGIAGVTIGMFFCYSNIEIVTVIKTGMACDSIFDKGICCGGYFGFVNQRWLLNGACGYLTNAGWTAIEDMPEKLAYHASIPLPDKSWWLISGGQSKKLGMYIISMNLYC